MNISRFFTCALLTLALPALAQPDAKPGTELPYPKVTPEDAAKLGLTDKPMQFHLHDVTLSDALDSLQMQSGLQINKTWSGYNPDLQKKLSLDVETRSFDEAFAALLKAADVKAYLQRFGSDPKLNLLFGEDDQYKNSPATGSDGFRLVLAGVSSNLNKNVTISRDAPPQRSQNLYLQANVALLPDPPIPIVGSPRVRLTRVDDDKGRSLRPEETPQSMYGNYYYGQQSSLTLLTPQADATSIARLEGTVTYILSSKREKWEVPDVLTAKNVSHDFRSNGQTFRVSIQDATVSGTILTLNLRVIKQTPDANADTPNPLFTYDQISASMRLLDSKGRALQSNGFSGNGNGDTLTMNGNFLPPPFPTTPAIGMDGKPMDAETPTLQGPIKLTFNVPTEFVQTQVPFSFHDLPLP